MYPSPTRLRPPVVALLLTAAACLATPSGRRDAAVSRPPPDGPSDEFRQLSPDEQARHAVSRLTFGARPGEVARVRRMGVDRWIATQLRPERMEDTGARRIAGAFPLLDRSAAELYRAAPPPAQLLARARRTASRDGQGPGDRGVVVDTAALVAARHAANQVVAELTAARVARAVVSDRELQEVMVDFWENHFNVFVGKGPIERYLLVQFDRDVIRPNALGDFRVLLGAVAKSPAMLYYLDNWRSAADSGAAVRRVGQGARGLNENYARELLELHTLGADGGYTQGDVRAVARALTGWSIRPPAAQRPAGGRDARGAFVFRPEWHDAGDKVVLGHVLPGGRGIDDGEAVLDIIARHPSTARFIAAKLARRFVSDTPPAALVERAAGVFQRTHGDIRETVRAIVTSPDFFSRAAYRAKVKSPFEVVVSTLRAFDAQPDTTARTARAVARLGQPLFGHQAPNGYPETGAAWLGAGAILDRVNFGLAAAAGRLPGVSLARWPGRDTVERAPRAEQVDAVVAALLGGTASPETRQVLMTGAHPLLPDTARAASFSGLAQIVGLALGSPEFQRR